jgi:hypothetical protein
LTLVAAMTRPGNWRPVGKVIAAVLRQLASHYRHKAQSGIGDAQENRRRAELLEEMAERICRGGRAR